MKVGQKIKLGDKTGKVQYIHPKKRFVVLEFTLNTCLGVRKYKQAHQLVNGQLFI